MSPLQTLVGSEKADVVRRYLRFILVGGSGLLVDMAVLYALISAAAFEGNLAINKLIAAESAMFSNFVWNELWTFNGVGRDLSWSGVGLRFLKFNLICSLGIVGSGLLLHLFVYGWGWNIYLGNLVAIIFVSFWNFGLSFYFGWGKQRKKVPARGGQTELLLKSD